MNYRNKFELKDAGIEFYLADSIDLLPTFPASTVDLLLTDMPYGQNYKFNGGRNCDPLNQHIVGDKDLGLLRGVAPMLDRLIKDNKSLYFFASANELLSGEMARIINEHWKYKSTLIWNKGNCGTLGDLRGDYACNYEKILYAHKGRSRLFGKRPLRILTSTSGWSTSRDRVHPTVKPVSLLRELIENSTRSGDLILDPFAGSATTLQAALDSGRRAIGIEIEPKWFNAGVERLSGRRVADAA